MKTVRVVAAVIRDNWFNEQKSKRFLAKAVPASISFLK